MIRSPEVQFFATHPRVPPAVGARLPVTTAHFRDVAGLPVHHLCQLAAGAWHDVGKHWPVFQAWAEAGGPLPPESWPPRIAEAWKTALRGLSYPTPCQFTADFTPLDKVTLYRSPILRVPGVNELAAAAVGFPLSPDELAKAAAALPLLVEHRNFFIWAGCLDLSIVPLPQTLIKRRGQGKKKARTALDLVARLDMRGQLEMNPLAVGRDNLRWALPDDWDVSRLERCQQLPWYSRSTRANYVLDATPVAS